MALMLRRKVDECKPLDIGCQYNLSVLSELERCNRDNVVGRRRFTPSNSR
jgi:hypothetical protein